MPYFGTYQQALDHYREQFKLARASGDTRRINHFQGRIDLIISRMAEAGLVGGQS